MTDELLRWHYTPHLPAILAAGEIRPTNILVRGSERSSVSFSANQDWERTAHKGWVPVGQREKINLGEPNDFLEHGIALYRIGVRAETAPVGWAEFRNTSGIRNMAAHQLEAAGRSLGANPEEWFVSYTAVPRDLWVAIERWSGDGWETVPEGSVTPSVDRRGLGHHTR